MCGRPMVIHVIHSLQEVEITQTVVVVGHAAKQVSEVVGQQAPKWSNISFVEQRVQNGTGDATIIGLSAIDKQLGTTSEIEDTSTIIVMPGDTPLLRASTISALVREHQQTNNAATLLTAFVDEPTGYGRIIRAKDDHILRIVEERDATPEIRSNNEIQRYLLHQVEHLSVVQLRRRVQDEYDPCRAPSALWLLCQLFYSSLWVESLHTIIERTGDCAVSDFGARGQIGERSDFGVLANLCVSCNG